MGHSTVLLDLGGTRFLTDPLLTQRVAHLRRRTRPPRADIRLTDIVLVSHAHADHLHRRSLKRVATASPHAIVIAPEGSATLIPTGFQSVIEVSPGATLSCAGAEIHVVAAEHDGRRGPWERRDRSAVGYLISKSGRTAYFAGDTDLFEGMTQLPHVDLALLPIGGWWKTLGTGHLDPTGAAEAVARIEPELVLPVHWGTFAPEDLARGLPTWSSSSGRDFERALATRGLLDRLIRLAPGTTAVW